MKRERTITGTSLASAALRVLLAVVLVAGLNPGLSQRRAWAAEDRLAPAQLGEGHDVSVAAVDETVIVGEGSVMPSGQSDNQSYGPFAPYYENSLSEQVYTASEIGKTGTIKALSFNVGEAGAFDTGLSVYLGATTSSGFSSVSDAITSGLTLVYKDTASRTYGAQTGWEEISFNGADVDAQNGANVFQYNGGDDNLVVVVLRDGTVGSGKNYSSSVKYVGTNTAGAYGEGETRALINASDTAGEQWRSVSAAAEYSGTKKQVNSFRPNIRLTFGDDPSTVPHSITSETATGGSFTVTNSAGETIAEAMAKTEVTLTPAADADYQFASFTVTDASGSPVAVTDNKFTMPSRDVTVTAKFKQVNFPTDGVFKVTDDNPLIKTQQDLNAFAAAVNAEHTFAGKTVSLTDDAPDDLKVTAPIGSQLADLWFEGTFNGNGKTIDVQATGEDSQGMFGAVKGTQDSPAVIENLTVKGAVQAKTARAGGVVAVAGGYVTLQEVRTAGDMTVQAGGTEDPAANVERAGGLVGFHGVQDGTLSFMRCSNKATVSADAEKGEYVGGMVGYEAYSCSMVDSYSTGAVSGKSGVGGLVGYMEDGSLSLSNVYTTRNGGSGSAYALYGAGFSSRYAPKLYVTNSYYEDADNSVSPSVYDDSIEGFTAKTPEALKALAPTLGGEYVADASTPLNGGYPVLEWENPPMDGTHKVVLAPTQNGTASLSAARATSGTQVSVTATPAKGYQPDAISVKDSDGNDVTVTEGAFAMPDKNVTVTVTFKTQPYFLELGDPNLNSASATFELGGSRTIVAQPSALLSGKEISSPADVSGLTFQLYEKTSSGDVEVGNAVAASYNEYSIYWGGDPLNAARLSVTPSTAGAHEYYVKGVWKVGNETVAEAASSSVTLTVEKTRHQISIAELVLNGSVTVDAESSKAQEGTEVTVTATPVSGYQLDAITVTAQDGSSVAVSGSKFTMPDQPVTVSAAFVAAGAIDDKFDYTSATPEIATQNDWDNFVICVNAGQDFTGKTVSLTTDVTASKMVGRVEYATYDARPDGEDSRLFKGIFDGGKHTVALSIASGEGSAAAGLFAGVYGDDASHLAVVKNLKLSGSIAMQTGDYQTCFVGAAVGVGKNMQVIDVSNDAAITHASQYSSGSYQYVGGIVGAVKGYQNNYGANDQSNTAVIGCANRGAVSAQGYAGGIVGNLRYWSASIQACYNTGVISSAKTELRQAADGNYKYLPIPGQIVGYAGNQVSSIDASYAADSDENPRTGAGYVAGKVDDGKVPVSSNCTFASANYGAADAPEGWTKVDSLAALDLNGNIAASQSESTHAEKFLTDMGSAKINAGLPILKWEAAFTPVTYTVTFMNGDAQAAQISVEQDESLASSNVPEVTKDGYTLDGWYEGDQEVSFPFAPTTNMTLTAKWTLDAAALDDAIAEAKALQARVGAQGENGIAVGEDADAVDDGENFVTQAEKEALDAAIAAAVAAIAALTSESTHEDVTAATTALSKAVSDFTTAAEKTGLKGHEYTVTFNADGGTPAPEAQTVVRNQAAQRPTADPAKDGYGFTEWQLGGVAYAFDAPVIADITLDAAYRLDRSAMDQAIQVAQESLGSADFTIAADAADVAAGTHYVTAQQKAALEEKLAMVQQAADATTPEAVKSYADLLTGAIDTFEGAKKQVGTKEEPEATIADEDVEGVQATGYATETEVAGASVALEVEDQTAAQAGVLAATYATDLGEREIKSVYQVDLVLKKADRTEESLNNAAGALKVMFPVPGVADGRVVQVIQLHTAGRDDTGTPEKFVYYPKVQGQKVTVTLNGKLSQFIIAVPQVSDWKVTFDPDNGAATWNELVQDGQQAAKPATDPTKSGYTFKEWQLGGSAYDFNSAVSGDITLKAAYAKNAAPASTASTAIMWRLYNKYSGEHLYTSDSGERASLIAGGWNDEGKGWTAPSKSGTPVYRLYNPYHPLGDHHYTTDKSEYDHLCSVGWSGEGVGWYSDDAKGVPLYRQYNPYAYGMGQSGAHNYTTSAGERDNLVRLGWHDEKIAWYGVK